MPLEALKAKGFNVILSKDLNEFSEKIDLCDQVWIRSGKIGKLTSKVGEKKN